MSPSENRPNPSHNWAELNVRVLILIFEMVGVIDLLKSVEFVCRAWRKVAKDEPEIWRRIDMTNHGYAYNSYVLRDPTKLAIDRSKGMLEEFRIEYFCNIDLLQYLSNRTTSLKKLCLISCFEITDEELVNLVKKQPLLKELQITFGSFRAKMPELVGREIPKLKLFKLNGAWNYLPFGNFDDNEEILGGEEAFGIGKTMHQLRHLELIGNRLTNEGLKAILEGCPHLETLDIRRCHNLNMDSDMRARCSKLSILKLPSDSLDDYEFQEAASPGWSDMDMIVYDEF